jgi:hypothetical protein
MAKAIVDLTTCDWHAALPEAPRVPATQERSIGDGKVVDLCDPCGWYFDTVYHRRDDVLPRLQPDVLDALRRSARETKPVPRRNDHAQLALAPDNASEQAPEPENAPKRRKGVRGGAWRDDVIQVICPLKHRAGSPDPYYVDLRNRTQHGKSHNRDDGTPYDGPDIGFELQDGQTFTHFCVDHAVCAQNGGYGFLSEDARRAHQTKCRHWPAASKKDRETANERRAA